VPVYRLRGQLLPLLYLDEELKLRPRRTHDERLAAESVNIVVLQAEDRVFGLVVDSVIDTQEIVVKPLGQHLKGIKAYAGSTIMGDGTISLILDVIGLAQQGRVLNEHRDRSQSNTATVNAATGNRQSWLIVDPGDGSQAAISLGEIARLEEFPLTAIEHSGSDEVVQYRGHILPLFRLTTGSYGSASEQKTSVPVVVYQSAGKQVGIVVGHIIDIVEHIVETNSDDPSLIPSESQIISGRVTRVIDLGALVGTAM
jgi:two-component system chemotaxis sensor kinase CheA